MQGTAIAGLTIAMGNIEAAETAAGQGLRMSSRQQQSERKNLLFTEILNHKGTALRVQTEAGLLTGEEAAGSADETDDGYGASSDVCGLLMQLLLMNGASAGQQGNAQNTVAPDSVAANSAIDNLAAATVTTQDSGVLTAAELPAPSEAAGGPVTETVDVKQKVLESFGAKLMDAMAKTAQVEGEMAAENDAAESIGADPASEAAGQGQTQPATKPDGAAAGTNAFGQAVSAAAQNSGVRNGQTGTIGELKAQVKETNAARPGVLTNNIETSDDAALTRVSATAGDQADGGMGELLSDDDKGAALGRDESNAVILNGTYTNTNYGGVDTAEAAAAVEKAFNRFADDVTSLQTGVNEIKIVLEPESLGTMIITVMRTENGISAKIKADDKQVCEAISGQLHKLISSLEARGIHVEDMDVSYNQTDLSNGFNQQNFSGGRDETAREQNLLRDTGNGGSEYAADRQEAPGEPAITDTLLEYRL